MGDADQRLLARVRPPRWRNPTPRARYDLVVIGAGTGGLVSAALAATLGARVALVERARMGGDCLNYGCVPSKGMLKAARVWAATRAAAACFGGPTVAGDGDFHRAMERMRTIRAELSVLDSAERFSGLGVDVYFGAARFTARDAVSVQGTTLPFHRAIVATGASAVIPAVPGLREAMPLTHETVFDLDTAPGRLIVLGAGPIGCELAQAFARFGSRVTLLDAADRVLPREDPEAAAVVQEALAHDGIEFVARVRLAAVTTRGAARVVTFDSPRGQQRREAPVILAALGRTPNLDLALDRAGIASGAHGITVDDRLQTTNRRVYAIGDVVSPAGFTHLADAHARIAVRNALFFGRGRRSRLIVPRVTYTSPELAHAGLSPVEAERRGIRLTSLTVPLSDVDRARLDGADQGFMRVHVRRGGDTIVGATLVAEHAGEVISGITLAMAFGIGLDELSTVLFPYPTVAEVVRKVADAHQRRRLTPRARALLNVVMRVTRRLP